MDSNPAKTELKKQLLSEVARFYRRDGRLWKEPIVQTLRELRDTSAQAVFFGGTPRALLISRLFRRKLGRPRDVDIVVSGITIDRLRERFQEIIARQTRFGGLQLRRREWQFDLWPLHETWAFVRDSITTPDFSALPSTTFFNLEAIAVEVWARPGQSREVFSGTDQFFEGILTRTLEINREENPYPELCVVRALILAASLDFKIGPRLAGYIASRGADLAAGQLEDIQHGHYGRVTTDGTRLREWIARVAEVYSRDHSMAVRLPIPRQLEFWPENDGPPSIHLRCLVS